MTFISVINFAKFQHYKDRRPPWIKLYRDLLDDDRFFDLSDAERYHLIGLFILASQHDNKIPNKPDWIRHQLRTSKAISLQRLIDTGWVLLVSQNASPALADRKQEPIAETETEKSRDREETDTESAGAIAPLQFGEFNWVRVTSEQYAKLKDGMNGHLDAYIARFDRWVNEAPDAKHRGVKRRDRHAYESILNWFDKDVSEGKVKRAPKPHTLLKHTAHRCEFCEDPHEWNCELTICDLGRVAACRDYVAQHRPA